MSDQKPKTTGLIAVHLPNLNGGGAEKVVLILCEQFLARGYAVDLVVGRATGAYRDVVPDGVNLVDLHVNKTIKSILALRTYIRARRPGILLSNLGPQNVAAVLANILASNKTRVFAVQHNSLSDQARGSVSWQMRLMPFFYRLVLPAAAGVIAVSRGVADDIIRTAGLPDALVSVIPNPVRGPTENQLASRPTEPFFDTSEPVILGLGRLVEAKDFHTLIAAVAIVNQRYQPVRLALMGAGPLRDALIAQAKAVGLENRFVMLPFATNPYPYLNRASVVVLSSRYEGFGNVLVEAMACGTAVVSTDCPYGPSEILDGGRYGALIPVGDAEAMARAIDSTLRAPTVPDILKDRASAFDPKVASNAYLKLFS